MNTEDMRRHFEPDGSPARVASDCGGARCAPVQGSEGARLSVGEREDYHDALAEITRLRTLVRPWMLRESYDLRGQNERLRKFILAMHGAAVLADVTSPNNQPRSGQ